MEKLGNKPSYRLGLGVILSVACFVIFPLLVRAYTAPVDGGGQPLNPGAYPATGSTFDQFNFLNGSSASQQKKGSLLVGPSGGTSALCLNTPLSPTDYSDSDGTTCIHTWNDVRNVSSANSLPLGSIGSASGSSIATDYAKSSGFVRIRGSAVLNQRYSLIVEANSNPSASHARAIYASDAPYGSPSVGTNWAAFFSGNIMITDKTWNSSKNFCLNGINPAISGSTAGCITRWTDPFLAGGGVGFVSLSSSNPQSGNLAVTGSTQVSSMQAGNIAGVAIANTCGDGICSKNTVPPEDGASCSIDCQVIGASTFLSVYPGDGANYFYFQPWNNSNQAYGVILRKAGSAPTASPVDGVVYGQGDVIGDAVVAYSGQLTSQIQDQIPDNGLHNGTTYYYALYSGNAFPRYGLAASASATPAAASAQLSIRYIGYNVGDVSISTEHTFFAGMNCTVNCVAYFTPGTIVTLLDDTIQSGYTFTGFSGACNGKPSCTFTISGNTEVTATFIKNPTGGSGGGRTVTGG